MLTHFKDPRGLSVGTCYEIDASLSIQENIQQYFPSGLNHEITDLIINGEMINPLEYNLNRKATVIDDIRIIQRQQGVGEIISVVVAIIATVASYVLVPKPKVPNSSGEQKDSSNNKLTGQSNIARPYQAKPDIYGCRRVYPDLISPAGSEYIENKQYVDHLFCIGIGEYQIEKARYDETLLDKIAGTTYQTYKKGDVIPIVKYEFSSAEVNGQTLTPPNLSNEVLHKDEFNDFVSFNNTDGTVAIVLNENDETSYIEDLPLPVQINFTVNADVTSNYYPIVTNTNVEYRASLQSLQRNDKNQLVLEANQLSVVSYEKKIKGNITSVNVNTSYLKLQHTGGVYTDAFILPEEGTELWVDIAFQRGLQGYVELRFIWWRIDEFSNEIDGTRETLDWDIRRNTYSPQNVTVKITPEGGKAKYAMIIGRLNDGHGDLRDETKVDNVFSVSYDYDFMVNDSLMYVRSRATSQATSIKELKFNIEVTRKTITYNRETRQVDYTLRPSRSFADAVLHEFVYIHGRSPDELDLDELYDIDARLKAFDKRLGYFDFSFDDIDVSLGQRIEAMCNAARVFVYRDGQKWRFSRIEEKLRPSAMFNSVNLLNSSDGGSVQKKSNLPSTYDGVQIEYIDASKDHPGGTDKKDYINLKVEAGKIVESKAFRPNKIQLAGCTNHFQAMNRAQLEIRKLIYERTFVEDEALTDANLVNKGDLVLWVDTWDATVTSGEIININGDQFYVDQQLALDADKCYRVAITDNGGYPSNWITVTGHDTNSFTADFNDAYTADNIMIQMGSIFIITEVVSEEPTEFLLTDKTYNDGTYKIKLTNYDKRIFDYDREIGFFIS